MLGYKAVIPVIHRTRSLLAVALFVSFSSLAFSQTAAERSDAIAATLRDQQFEKALDLLRPTLQQFPDNAQFWAMQGVAYAGVSHKKQALASFQRSLQISPNYLPALQGAAQIEFEAGDAAAIPLLQRFLRLRPDDQTGHGMLAVLEYQHGHCTAALPHFERAGSLFDTQVSALHAYGICLVRLKKLNEAVAVFQRAVSAQPDDPQERRLLASVQLMANKPKDALVSLEPLLKTDQADRETMALASAAYEDAGETNQAVNTLRKAILTEPHYVNLYLDLAHICFRHNSFQIGIDALSDGINQQPSAAPLYLARGVLYIQLAEYEKAEADLDRAHELDPAQSLSSAARAMVAVQKNDVEQALKVVQAKLTHKPDDALLLYLQADFLLQRGAAPGSPDFRLAMRSARRAVTLQPTLAEAHGVLAKLFLQSGQYRQAIEECRKTLDSDPKDQTAVYHLIQALRKTGRTDEIPGLLKRLAQLREESAREASQRNRFRLVESEAQSDNSSKP